MVTLLIKLVGQVYRMLRFDLKLTLYTISVMQHLKDSDTESRQHFVHWMKENDQITDVIWFSDEANFHLNAQVNKSNCRFWGSEKPDLYLEKTLHGEKVTAWVAMTSAGIVGPFFFEDKIGRSCDCSYGQNSCQLVDENSIIT